MAGRSKAKLEEMRSSIKAQSDLPLVIADASDPAALRRMAERTEVATTRVGPYQLYGTPLGQCEQDRI
jgi:short subunit dehydrogenase-like uncharacterized protein